MTLQFERINKSSISINDQKQLIFDNENLVNIISKNNKSFENINDK